MARLHRPNSPSTTSQHPYLAPPGLTRHGRLLRLSSKGVGFACIGKRSLWRLAIGWLFRMVTEEEKSKLESCSEIHGEQAQKKWQMSRGGWDLRFWGEPRNAAARSRQFPAQTGLVFRCGASPGGLERRWTQPLTSSCSWNSSGMVDVFVESSPTCAWELF